MGEDKFEVSFVFFVYIFLNVVGGTCATHMCDSQKTESRSLISPSTLHLLGTELKSSDLPPRTFA